MARKKNLPVCDASLIPTVTDIAWAAGFIEGDGYIRKNKTTHEVQVTQKQEWPLLRLQALFGGSINVERGGILKRNYFRWRTSGERARAIVRLIKPYLSPWRVAQTEGFY